MTPELRIVLALGFVWAFATGIIVGRRSRERELNRLTDNERFARECMRDAMKHRDEVQAELWETQAKLRWLQDVTGVTEAEDGRRVWN